MCIYIYICMYVKYNLHFFIMPSLKTAVSDGLGSFQQDRSVDRDGECTTLASETNGKKPQSLWNNDHVSFFFLFNVYNQFKIYRHTLFRHPNIILLNLSSGHVSSSNLIIDQQLCVRSLSLDDLTVRSTWCPGKVDWDMHAGDVGFVSRAWQPEMLAEYKMFYMRIYIYIYIYI